jgi:hypothetical protein
MLNGHSRLRPNVEEVASDVLDGEVVMINLSTGMYYSMEETGAVVWELIREGRNLDEIGSALFARYDVSPDRAEADVARLAAQLVEEHLVVVTDLTSVASDAPALDGRARLPYVPPRLEIYRDVGHLVALDPPMPGLSDLPWREPREDPTQNPSA